MPVLLRINGGSSVFDGVAYLPELNGSRDTCILQADGTEGIYLAELDLEHNWFVAEQVEEEDTVRTLIDNLKLIGEDAFGQDNVKRRDAVSCDHDHY